jgi:hypothetical protein
MHEIGHHVIRELYGGNPVDRPRAPTHERNHDGFANSYSSGSLNEGFATFWSALVLARGYGLTQGEGQFTWASGSSISLNVQTQAWTYRRDAAPTPAAPIQSREELAFAGLLWDLIDDDRGDSARSNETIWQNNGSTFHPRDDLSISPNLILEALHFSKPRSIREFYLSLRDRLPESQTNAAMNPRGSGLSQLDELVVMQRIFHDADGDWTFDLGEEVGRAANGGEWHGWWHDASDALVPADIAARPNRENLPPTLGSFGSLTLVDPQGREVDVAVLEVSVDMGPENEALNYRFEQPVRSGAFQIEMPPPHYEAARATFRVLGSADPPAVLENADYWARVPSQTPLFTRRFTVRDTRLYLPLTLVKGAPAEGTRVPPRTSEPPSITPSSATPSPQPTVPGRTVGPTVTATRTSITPGSPTATTMPSPSATTPVSTTVTATSSPTIAGPPSVTPSPTQTPAPPPSPTATTLPNGVTLRWALITDENSNLRMAFTTFEEIKLWMRVEMPAGAPNRQVTLDFEVRLPDGTRFEPLSASTTHELKADAPSLSITRMIPSDLPTGEYRYTATVIDGGNVQQKTALFYMASGLHFEDDFSDPGSGWPESEDEQGRSGYLNGEYQIRVDTPNNRRWTIPAVAGLEDFVVEVSSRRVAEVSGTEGILFGRDEARTMYWLFQVDDRGRYRLVRQSDEAGQETLVPWTAHPAIRTGLGWNQLMVVRRGGEMGLYANWERLGLVTEPRLPAVSRQGLGGGAEAMGGADHRFETFRCYRLGP